MKRIWVSLFQVLNFVKITYKVGKSFGGLPIFLYLCNVKQSKYLETMATIKSSFTNIQQSKKLAKILPIESADMCYVIDYAESNKYGGDHFNLEVDTYGFKVKTTDNIPCWTIGALLSVLPNPKIYQAICGYWCCDCWRDAKDVKSDESTYIGGTNADNPIDACVAMIEKLHELKLL